MTRCAWASPRAAIEETEPVIRDADLLTFRLGALKQSEAPGVDNACTIPVIFWREACQICRYAGMSDKLTSFGLYGFRRKLDQHGQTAQAAAQLIWYFLKVFLTGKATTRPPRRG